MIINLLTAKFEVAKKYIPKTILPQQKKNTAEKLHL